MTSCRTYGRCGTVLLTLALAGCTDADPAAEQSGVPPTSQCPRDEPSLCLRDVTGTEHRPFVRPDLRAVVFLFVLHDCPIANAFAPEMERLYEEFAPRPTAFFLVHCDADLGPAEARAHAEQYGLRLPVLLDPGHELARRAQARRVPEAAVFAPDGRLLYCGRIDNRYADYGKLRAQPTQRDLRDALEAALGGRPVPRPWPAPVGCFISGLDGP
jgi:hypothetical protein